MPDFIKSICSSGVSSYRKFLRSPSIGKKLDEYKGVGPGFDFCRLYLAMTVLAWHSWMLVVGEQMITTYNEVTGLWLLRHSTLPMFFALSGFLIAGSAQRLSCKNFLINRSLRIFPALTVEIILSLLILGPIFTVMPLQNYFTDSETHKYLLNIFGYIQFHLPGVFVNNPFDIVNGSLWTVPLEIACYVLMMIAIVMNITKRAILLAIVATIYPLIWLIYMVGFYDSEATGISAYFFGLFFNFSGVGLIPCFIFGVACYAARYRIPHSPVLFVAALIILIVVAVSIKSEFINDPAVNIIINPMLTYIVIYLGLCRMPKLALYSTGDYSYGIYLYAYPIQQALIQLWPKIAIPVHLVLSVIIVSVFAAFSWHFIEKPVLSLRKNFSFVSRKNNSAQESA